MSRKLLLLAGIMLLSLPAFAAVQNVKVSGDITTYAVLQNEFDLNDNVDAAGLDDTGFFVTIARLRVDADLTDNVAATIRLINERNWDGENNANTDIDLDLAYLTLKEIFYSPLTLIIGRQELRYGNALIVGDPDTNAASTASDSNFNSYAPFLSKRKAFDAIRAILDYDPWTIDLVYAKINEVYEATNSEDTDLYGVNIGYKFAQYDAEAEGYFFAVDSNNQDIYVVGLRGSLVPIEGLLLGGEVAYQFGDYTTAAGASRDQDAWAASIYGSYTWANEYEPTLKLAYDYRSGDEGSSTGDYEAWLPLYEDQTKGLIADYLFAGANNGVSSNAHIINVGFGFKPLEDLNLAVDWFHYILDEDLNSGSLSGTVTSYDMTDDDCLGDEIDLKLTYDYSEDVQFGLEAGVFIPGDAFANANDDEAYEVIGSVSVSF
jgi:hypothetical protein